MSLRDKLRRRTKRRDRQEKLFDETGERGHAKAVKRENRSIRFIKRLIKERKEKLIKELLPGFPYWAGGKRIMRTEVWPVVKPTGIQPTSGKRKETFGNPSSDHFWLNIFAFAKDYATANNQELAQRIRAALDPGGVHHDYESFFIERYGYIYRVQIIAVTHGTGPHLHVGIKREGRAS